jgi:hypothetical protein
MKARVKLALQQADMRSRLKSDRGGVRTARPIDLKRRVVATIFAYERGWTPARIANHFGWQLEDVKAWFQAGTPLL